jgi:hypothetical protein
MARTTVIQPVIVQKWYDLTLWLFPLVSKFPKNNRYTLGSRMEGLAIEVLESLVEATYSKEKLVLLKKVNLDLEKFRFLSRLANRPDKSGY